ncbi:hypothetical protein D3C73_1017430 [compost metagenome]
MALAPQGPLALPHHNRPEPAGKSGRLTQLMQIQKSFKERLLNRILRQMDILQHVARHCIRHPPAMRHQLGERLRIPLSRLLYPLPHTPPASFLSCS